VSFEDNDVVDRYQELYDRFQWTLPTKLNLGWWCADRHPARALAMVELGSDGTRREHTFGELSTTSSRLAAGLAELGVNVGDRIAILLPQRFETGVAHLAAYKLGAMAVPLSVLFGPEALGHRLQDAQPTVMITDGDHADLALACLEGMSATVVLVDGPVAGPLRRFNDLVNGGRVDFASAQTSPDTPALIIYTSGTTGRPKGAQHGHRVLLGHLPGFELSHNGFPQPGDRFWTPADWAWIGGLMDALMPSWYHGVCVVCSRREGPFDPEWAARVIVDEQVRNCFLPPTALKLFRDSEVHLPGRLRSVMSGGEALGSEMLQWAAEHLGVHVNEIYGQTEANYLIGNSSINWPIRPGSMGRPYPGHHIAVFDEDGAPLPPGEMGEIVLQLPDPVAFLGYWHHPEETATKVRDGWLHTGDLGRVAEDGYLFFAGRLDDVINSAGYRIGPTEIEDCLIGHPAVAMAAVIGVPDPLRGEVVKAFIQLREGVQASPELERDIQQHVRTRLAAYEYPRQIEFVTKLPMTTTGKVQRKELRRNEQQHKDSSASY
jgi:acetyl-CoA synthetase